MVKVMGILNINEESFYKESRCTNSTQAIEKINNMHNLGAEIIDLGGCSTRPGSTPVSQEQEWEYLKPVLSLIPYKTPYKISIDTFYSKTVQMAYDMIGEFM
jgi:Dihydropteroate synthase and related enzymes